MIRLLRPNVAIRYPDDVKRLRMALNSLGYDASDTDIQSAYEDYSSIELCSGWLTLSWFKSDEFAARAAMRYLQKAMKTDRQILVSAHNEAFGGVQMARRIWRILNRVTYPVAYPDAASVRICRLELVGAVSYLQECNKALKDYDQRL